MSLAPIPSAADDGDEAREPVAVGSLMSMGAAKNLQPITVIEREEIELSGMRNLWDFIVGRVGYNSFGLDRPTILGAFRFALLVDGRSISDSTFDLDSLPVSAVERIEVLSDSAAGLYGPQAIAGAINIVLRDDFEGIEVQAGAERPVRGGGETEHASVFWGQPFGAGHLSVGVDLFRRNQIRESQRRYSRARWAPGGSFGDTVGVSEAGNTVLSFIPGRSPDEGGPLQVESLGDCEGGAFTGALSDAFGEPGWRGCGYAYAEDYWSWEQRDRDALYLGLDHPIGEAHSLYFDARLVQSDYRYPRWAPTIGSFSLTGNPDDWLTSGSNALYLDASRREALGFSPGEIPLRLFHRFAGHGNRDRSADLEEHDLTLGVGGSLAHGIGYDAHVRSYRHDEYLEAGTYVRRSTFKPVFADGSYDILNPLSTARAHRDAVEVSSVYRYRDRVLEHRTARMAFDGQGPALGGTSLGWVAGAEFAYEKRTRDPVYRDAAGNEVAQADVIGSWDIPFSGNRKRWSKFVELSLPLHERWDVVLAGRHDDHDDVESTFSHQVATRFRLNEALSLRGSWSKAAKPPGLGALHAANVVTRPRVFDPRTGFFYEITAITRGSPELEADRAESFSVGAVGDVGPVTLSADWYRIGLDRLLAIHTAQQLLFLECEDSLPAEVQIRRVVPTECGQPASLITEIFQPVSGDGKIDVSGLHLRARTGWTTRWADFEIDAWWSHVTKFHARASGVDDFHTVPRNRAHAMLRATRGDVTAQWSAYGRSDRPNSWGSSYPGWVGHDLSLRWEDAFGVAGAEITGGVINVADREPSADPEDPDYPDETFDSIRGRTLFLSVEKSW